MGSTLGSSYFGKLPCGVQDGSSKLVGKDEWMDAEGLWFRITCSLGTLTSSRQDGVILQPITPYTLDP